MRVTFTEEELRAATDRLRRSGRKSIVVKLKVIGDDGAELGEDYFKLELLPDGSDSCTKSRP